MRPLLPVLAAILAGCPTTYGDCGPYHDTETVTLTEEELARYAGDDGVLDDDECHEACRQVSYDAFCDDQDPTDDGGAELVCGYDEYCEGRHTDGVVRPHVPGDGPARFLAKAAHAEAASVAAFRRLARELQAHGAPAGLVDAAYVAARDEVRHARVMRKLAFGHGGAPPRVEVDDLPIRGLFAVALENAVEGVVHETWAALIALHQAAHAEEPDVAAAMAAIAEDEAHHAELAAAVHAWALPLLSPADRARVEAAARRAVADLAGIRYPAALGLPDGATVAALHAGMVREVWTA